MALKTSPPFRFAPGANAERVGIAPPFPRRQSAPRIGRSQAFCAPAFAAQIG